MMALLSPIYLSMIPVFMTDANVVLMIHKMYAQQGILEERRHGKRTLLPLRTFFGGS